MHYSSRRYLGAASPIHVISRDRLSFSVNLGKWRANLENVHIITISYPEPSFTDSFLSSHLTTLQHPHGEHQR